MSIVAKNVIMPGKYNNYLVGGNLCNAFAIGEIGSMDDFFIVASEPSIESYYPMITANILDSEGNVLFRLVKNMLLINPGHCSKIVGDHVGYEIHDSANTLIFRISTKFEYNESLKDKLFITTIGGNFYNKAKELVFRATSGTEEESIESFCKHALGFSGGLGIVQNYSKAEMDIVKLALLSKGSIHQHLTGEFLKKEIDFEGKYIHDAVMRNCRITIREGDFSFGNNLEISGCTINMIERAGRVLEFIKVVEKGNKPS